MLLSGDVDSDIPESCMVENMGVAVVISLLSDSDQEIIMYFRFKVRHFVFWLSADVGQCRQCYGRIGSGRKYGGSRWNFADNMSRNVIMLVYSKMADFRRIFPVFQFMPLL